MPIFKPHLSAQPPIYTDMGPQYTQQSYYFLLFLLFRHWLQMDQHCKFLHPSFSVGDLTSYNSETTEANRYELSEFPTHPCKLKFMCPPCYLLPQVFQRQGFISVNQGQPTTCILHSIYSATFSVKFPSISIYIFSLFLPLDVVFSLFSLCSQGL